MLHRYRRQAIPGRPHSPTGWLLAAVPALAFLALSKLILSQANANPTTDITEQARPSTGTERPAPQPPEPAMGPVPAELLTGARMAAFTHRQATGHDITADTFASHLAIPPELAGNLLHALGGTGTTGHQLPTVTHVNGTARPERTMSRAPGRTPALVEHGMRRCRKCRALGSRHCLPSACPWPHRAGTGQPGRA